MIFLLAPGDSYALTVECQIDALVWTRNWTAPGVDLYLELDLAMVDTGLIR